MALLSSGGCQTIIQAACAAKTTTNIETNTHTHTACLIDKSIKEVIELYLLFCLAFVNK